MVLRIPIERVEPAAAESMKGAAAIDESSFRLLYERTARPLWAYLARAARDSQAADDLLQEVYHRFLRADVPEMDAAGHRNYLFRIATNLLRDRARAAKPQVELSDIGSGELVNRQVELRTDLARALDDVGDRERELLWMAYAEGFSHREIAAATGCKEQSVRPMLHRAKSKLANLLRSRGFGQ